VLYYEKNRNAPVIVTEKIKDEEKKQEVRNSRTHRKKKGCQKQNGKNSGKKCVKFMM
jgi:hypothetical protein